MIEVPAADSRDSGLVRRILEGWAGPLITTNGDTGALRFYQRLGFDLAGLHRDAVTAARAVKPSIPHEVDGIRIRHELELRLGL